MRHSRRECGIVELGVGATRLLLPFFKGEAWVQG